MRNYINNLKANSKKGFSLVELIIVIAIMAILVGVVASQVIPYMEKSRKGKDQQQLSSLTTSVVTAVSDHSTAITTFGETKIVDMTADKSTTDVFDDEFRGFFKNGIDHIRVFIAIQHDVIDIQKTSGERIRACCAGKDRTVVDEHFGLADRIDRYGGTAGTDLGNL